MNSRRKLYYVPGLISLIVLPGLFLFFFNDNSTQQYALEVSSVAAELLKKDSGYLSVYKNFPPERNYLDINLTGDSKSDKTKLEFSQIWLRENKINADTANGIHYHFKDSAKYWTFVKALDILEQSNVRRHVECKKDIWVFGPQFKSEGNLSNWGGCIVMTDVSPKPSWLQIVYEKIIKSWKGILPIIISFLLLFWFSVRFMLKL